MFRHIDSLSQLKFWNRISLWWQFPSSTNFSFLSLLFQKKNRRSITVVEWFVWQTLFMLSACTVFENHRKSLLQHCERSELRLHYSFWKPEACGQTVLSDRSVLIGQKLVENAKMPKFICDILSNFQTMCKSPDSLIMKLWFLAPLDENAKNARAWWKNWLLRGFKFEKQKKKVIEKTSSLGLANCAKENCSSWVLGRFVVFLDSSRHLLREAKKH